MSQNSNDIVKKLLNSIGKANSSKNLSENDIREKIKTIDKNEVIRKLNSMNMGKAAQMLSKMSDEDIIKQISENPGILRKLNEILKGEK